MTEQARRFIGTCALLYALLPLTLLVFALAAPPAAAQTTPVTNPTTLVFTPSADHDARLPDGRLKVASYRFDVYSVGASAPFQSTNLGRPTPGSDGSISYDFSSAIAAWPLPGGNYEARVAAVGPEGTAASTPSNPFNFASSCSYALSGTSASATAAGGTAQVGVTTAGTCTWTASESLSWVSLNNTSGTGSGSVTITIAANTSTSARTGVVTVAGQAFTITQAGATPCSYTLSGTSASVPASGGTTPVNVATAGSCAWTASESLSWASLNTASGTGNGSVTITVAANTSASARTGVVTVAGQAFTITQAGVTPCSFTLSSTSASLPAAAGTTQIGVTAGSACTWTASESLSWVSLSTAGGTGNGSVTVTVAANTSTSSRSGVVTIAGQMVTINQAGAGAPPCSYTLSNTSASVPAGGGGTQVTVTTTSACAWTAAESLSWVSLNTTSGTGSGTVVMTVAANSSTTRTGTVTVAGQGFTITQAGTTPPATGLPAPWQNQDIGSVGMTGSSSYASGIYTVTGSGSDIWGTADSFQYAYQPLSGNGQIVARVTSMQNTHYYAKAGVMLRESPASNSRQVLLNVLPDGNVRLLSRSATGGSTVSLASGVTQAMPAWLRLARNGTTVTASVSADGTTWRTVGTVTVSMGSSAHVGLAVTSRNTGTRNTATFDNVSVGALPASTALPSPWATHDIGSVGLSGSATYSSGTFAVTGAGSDIWGTADSFRYVYQQLSGDGEIVARVTSMQNTHYYAKAGVMLRESPASNSRQVLLNVLPDRNVRLLSRSATGGSTVSLVSGVTQAMPAWLRLRRTGTTITASISSNGTSWTTVGTTTVSLGSSPYVGLAVTSLNTAARNTATFDSVTVVR